MLQASRWKQLWRPDLKQCQLQPDQLSFLLKTRARDAMRWSTMSDDPDGAIGSRVIGSDLELAKAVQALTDLLAAAPDGRH